MFLFWAKILFFRPISLSPSPAYFSRRPCPPRLLLSPPSHFHPSPTHQPPSSFLLLPNASACPTILAAQSSSKPLDSTDFPATLPPFLSTLHSAFIPTLIPFLHHQTPLSCRQNSIGHLVLPIASVSPSAYKRQPHAPLSSLIPSTEFNLPYSFPLATIKVLLPLAECRSAVFFAADKGAPVTPSSP